MQENIMKKKIAEGKSPRRARRAVARNLVNIVFKITQLVVRPSKESFDRFV